MGWLLAACTSPRPRCSRIFLAVTPSLMTAMTFLRPPHLGKEVSAVLGRTNQSDVIIVDYTISKTHALYKPPRLKEPASIEDLSSSNGTWVNGIRIPIHDPFPLYSGMTLCLGRIVLRYYESSDLYDRLLKAR